MTESLPEAGGGEKSFPPVSREMMVVFCTFPDVEKARELAGRMIEQGLAACVNLLSGVESIYKWEGRVQRDAEALAIFKVASAGFSELEKAILVSHPYDSPEIVGITADKVEETYLDWVVAADGVPLGYCIRHADGD